MSAVQGFFDDSVEDGQVLILAGFVAKAVDWKEFNDVWQEQLDHAGLKSFHMSEFNAKDGRPDIAAWFYRAIEAKALCFFALAIEIAPIDRWVTRFGFKRAFADQRHLLNPYTHAFPSLVTAVLRNQGNVSVHEPIEFIFDERPKVEKNHVEEGFEHFKGIANEAEKVLLSRTPRFEDDEVFLPLQAADLFAWHVRKHWLRHRSLTSTPLALPWHPKREVPGFCFNVGNKQIRQNLRDLRERLINQGIPFDKPSRYSMRFTISLPKRTSGEKSS